MFESWVGKTWQMMLRVLLLTALALVISAPAIAQNTNGSGKNTNPAMSSCLSGQERCASSNRAGTSTVNEDDTAAGSLESDADVSKHTTPLSLVGLLGLGSLLAGFFMRK
jgi:hypothetical protein